MSEPKTHGFEVRDQISGFSLKIESSHQELLRVLGKILRLAAHDPVLEKLVEKECPEGAFHLVAITEVICPMTIQEQIEFHQDIQTKRVEKEKYRVD